MLQMAIDAAQAVLTKTNRKSSTAELKAAFDALEFALKNAGRKVKRWPWLFKRR